MQATMCAPSSHDSLGFVNSVNFVNQWPLRLCYHKIIFHSDRWIFPRPFCQPERRTGQGSFVQDEEEDEGDDQQGARPIGMVVKCVRQHEGTWPLSCAGASCVRWFWSRLQSQAPTSMLTPCALRIRQANYACYPIPWMFLFPQVMPSFLWAASPVFSRHSITNLSVFVWAIW